MKKLLLTGVVVTVLLSSVSSESYAPNSADWIAAWSMASSNSSSWSSDTSIPPFSSWSPWFLVRTYVSVCSPDTFLMGHPYGWRRFPARATFVASESTVAPIFESTYCDDIGEAARNLYD